MQKKYIPRKDYQKMFSEHLLLLSKNRTVEESFRLFLDFSISNFNLNPSEEDLSFRKNITEDDNKILLEMFIEYGELAENFRDPLGDLFMEYLSSSYKGQFFTPEDVCKLMAFINCDNLTDGQSVCDPCVGSGRNLLAAADIARNKNVKLRYYGSDIDYTCVRMTLLNCLINSMPGEIAWMDTLTMEHWKSYHIQLILHNGFYIPAFHTTGAGQTSFVSALKKTIEEKKEITSEIIIPSEPIVDNHGNYLLF